MSYRKFIEKQNQIYSNFENSSIKEKGTIPSDVVINGTIEYLIALRHSDKVNEEVARFSERMGKEIPILEYKAEDLHTTFTNKPFEESEEIDESFLEKLCLGVSKIRNLKTFGIFYNKWLYNENTIILKGNAPKEFYYLSKGILNNLKGGGIELRMPWASHMTGARFNEKINAEELKGFFKLMGEAPIIGESIPKSIDVGIIKLDKNNFDFGVYRSFKLK